MQNGNGVLRRTMLGGALAGAAGGVGLTGTASAAERAAGAGGGSPKAIQPRYRTIDGLSVRYADSGPAGKGGRAALLLSPWPESLFAFDQMWSRLARNTRLIAIDLPGFGHSERRETLLTPKAMGDFVIKTADAFGLKNPHAVGPDIGTGALLFAAANHPGRLRSIVIGSGGASYPIELGTVLRDWVFTPDVTPYRGIGRQIVNGALDTIENHTLPADIREDYVSAYEGDKFVESMAYARSYHTNLPALGELLPGIKTPVQIIAGRHDTAVPPANAEYLRKRLPHSRLDYLDVGHFTWEEDATGYATLVTDWWNGGHTKV
ncbi:alpha/beta fold hydrolase [Streptomyces sp. NPDC004609]|uniref:alpha/beta fold hydrolase n=1 Tax=Streptomyces sp. NPDC004609 TaxID=3364704 RepID=UPI00367B001F